MLVNVGVHGLNGMRFHCNHPADRTHVLKCLSFSELHAPALAVELEQESYERHSASTLPPLAVGVPIEATQI